MWVTAVAGTPTLLPAAGDSYVNGWLCRCLLPCFPQTPATSLLRSIPGFPFGEAFSWTSFVYAFSSTENSCSLPGLSLGHCGQVAIKLTKTRGSRSPAPRQLLGHFAASANSEQSLLAAGPWMGLCSVPSVPSVPRAAKKRKKRFPLLSQPGCLATPYPSLCAYRW